MQVSGLTEVGAQSVKYCKLEQGERGKADESLQFDMQCFSMLELKKAM